jgi:hypothetical protein
LFLLSGIIFKVNMTNNKVSHAGGSNPIPLSKGFIPFQKKIQSYDKRNDHQLIIPLNINTAFTNTAKPQNIFIVALQLNDSSS